MDEASKTQPSTTLSVQNKQQKRYLVGAHGSCLVCLWPRSSLLLIIDITMTEILESVWMMLNW